MASLNREQAQRRIAKDDGDPLDDVLVPANKSGSVECYHSTARCHTVRADTDTEPALREEAQQQGRAPCKVCVLDDVKENPGRKMSARLAAMDPEDVGLTPMTDGDGRDVPATDTNPER